MRWRVRSSAPSAPRGLLPRDLTVVAAIATTLAYASGVACAVPEQPSWRDQLVADSPCYRVDLSDGLDASAATEVHDLFGCLDHQGHLAALRAADVALDRPSRSDPHAAMALARAVNALPDVGVSPFRAVAVARDLLQDDPDAITFALDLYLEAAYGVRASRVRAGDVDTGSADALRRGALAPLAPVVPAVAGALLDEDLGVPHLLADVAADPLARRALLTVHSAANGGDGVLRDRVRRLPADVGEAILAARVDDNDVWPQASGDSLRDVAQAWLADGGVLDHSDVTAPAATLLADGRVRAGLQDDLVSWHARGHLAAAPAELAWLASVDVAGEPLRKGGTSALQSLARLLHDTNQPMRCSVDLWLTSLDFDLGNLAVTLLGWLAGSDPDLVQSGTSVFSSVLGVSDGLLVDVADTGVCPAFTPQVVEDLHAIDLLYDERADDLLVITLEALDTVQNGQQDRLPDLVDLVAAVQDHRGVPSAEEAVKDLAGTRLIADLIAMIPVASDPSAHGLSAGPDRPADLDDLWGVLVWAVSVDGGQTGVQRAHPLVDPLVTAAGTWEAAEAFAGVVTADGSASSDALALLDTWVAHDPGLAGLDTVALVLRADAVVGPSLQVAEQPDVFAALLAEAPAADGSEAPLAWSSRLIVDGTVDEVLTTLDVALDALGGLE